MGGWGKVALNTRRIPSGYMISENQVGIAQGYPLPALVACACIVVVVIAVNVLGERLFEQAQRTHR